MHTSYLLRGSEDATVHIVSLLFICDVPDLGDLRPGTSQMTSRLTMCAVAFPPSPAFGLPSTLSVTFSGVNIFEFRVAEVNIFIV